MRAPPGVAVPGLFLFSPKPAEEWAVPSQSLHFCEAARPGILPVARQGSMKIDFILFLGKICHLFKAAAGKFGLTHCKEKVGLGGCRLEFHPGAALPAPGQEFTIFRNLGDSHGYLHRLERFSLKIQVQKG